MGEEEVISVGFTAIKDSDIDQTVTRLLGVSAHEVTSPPCCGPGPVELPSGLRFTSGDGSAEGGTPPESSHVSVNASHSSGVMSRILNSRPKLKLDVECGGCGQRATSAGVPPPPQSSPPSQAIKHNTVCVGAVMSPTSDRRHDSVWRGDLTCSGAFSRWRLVSRWDGGVSWQQSAPCCGPRTNIPIRPSETQPAVIWAATQTHNLSVG